MIRYMRIFLILALTAGLTLAEETERTFKVEKGQKLTVDIRSGGSISIDGWDKDEVKVLIEHRGRGQADFLDISQREDGVDIEVNHGLYGKAPKGVHVHVNVPRRFDIEVNTMGGDIEINNVQGTFTGQTMGGDLELSGLKGTANLTTMGGEISLSDAELDGLLKTMGGEIEFRDVIGNVQGTTMGGDVTFSNVKRSRGKESDQAVIISTMGGEIMVDEAPAGADVHTMGGEITVKKAAVFVKAKTMGGDIEIEEIDGGVKATTMGGDIIVNMVGNAKQGNREVDLSSMGGSIEITLPRDIDARFDVELTYTRNSSREYEIQSDFDLKIEESREWDYDKGSPRKYITAKGQTGSGKHRIRIETINGDIIIRKR